ncbi:DNA gyrase subunit A, partial [Streptococcus thermophilus]|nr:DNA gyrase subunit A [Streptococcus thermophilus]
LLGVNSGEKIQAVVNVTGDASASDNYLFFTTVKGVVKRTPVQEFANIRSNGLKAITLKDDDELIGVTITDGHQNVIIGTHDGYAVSFDETTVRSMGRT